MKLFTLLYLLVALTAPAFGSFSAQTQTTVSVTTTAAQELAANIYRQYLLVTNLGSDTVFLYFGAAGTQGIPIPAGGHYEPNNAPKDSLWMKSASSTQNVFIVDGQ